VFIVHLNLIEVLSHSPVGTQIADLKLMTRKYNTKYVLVPGKFTILQCRC